MNFQELHETMAQGQAPKNSINSHEIVSITGYLMGVDKSRFHTEEEDPTRALFVETFDKLEKNKHAKILRNLCILRTSIGGLRLGRMWILRLS